MRTHTHAISFLLTLAWMLTTGWVNGQEAQSIPIEPQADQALQRMSDLLSGTPAFRFRARIMTDEALESGQLVRLFREQRVAIQRPNNLFVDVEGDNVGWTVWYDGDRLTILDKGRNVYASIPAPGTIEETLELVRREYGLTAPLGELCYADPHGTLTAGLLSGWYVGRHTVDGSPSEHLAMRSPGIDWQIWIDAGDRAVPRKVLITYPDVRGSPQFSALLFMWDLLPVLAENLFVFRAPEGATEMEMKALLGVEDEGKGASED